MPKNGTQHAGHIPLQGPRPGGHGVKWATEKLVQIVHSTSIIARHGHPDLLLYYDGGIGDELLCTVVLRELRKRGKRNVWMRTHYPELFAGNTDADRFVPGIFGLKHWTKLLGGDAIYPMYILIVKESDYYLPPPCHIITRMCQLVGIEGEITRRPYLHLTPEEKEQGKLTPRQIVIQSAGTTARFAHLNKQWYPERFQTVVDALKDRYNFIQVGSPHDPPLEGALDLRGKTTMRMTAALMSNALTFVGQVGFQMHLARSVDCRSVIIYGGKELPHQSGYSAFDNIVARVPCSPCWLESRCDYDRECMDRITPDQVIAAIEGQIWRYGEPLIDDVDVIPGVSVPYEATKPEIAPGTRPYAFVDLPGQVRKTSTDWQGGDLMDRSILITNSTGDFSRADPQEEDDMKGGIHA